MLPSPAVGIRRWVSRSVLPLLAAAPGITAQEPRGMEAGAAAVVLFSQDDFRGGGLLVAVRPGSGLRLEAGLFPGDRAGPEGTGLRGELTLGYLMAPARPTGLGLYGRGGVAGESLDGRSGSGWLVLGLGLESAPGGPSGWFIEAGAGGGFRLAVGWRRRWLHPRRRS